MKHILFFLVFALFAISSSASDAPQDQPIFEYRSSSSFINAMWSSDSTQFVFQEDLDSYYGVITPVLTWITVNMPSLETNRDSVWPLQPELPPNLTIPVYETDNQQSFVFVSPDQRYAVFVAEPSQDWPYTNVLPLALAEISSGNAIYLYQDDFLPDAIGIEAFTLDYQVRWSYDSSLFSVTRYRQDFNGFVFTSFQDDVANLDVFPLVYTPISVGTEDIYISEIFGALGDGFPVLMTSRRSNGDELWGVDIETPSNSQLITEGRIIYGAAFMDFDAQVVWYADGTGLWEHSENLQTNRLITANISFDPRSELYWSPDRHYLAVLSRFDGSQSSVRIYDLTQLCHFTVDTGNGGELQSVLSQAATRFQTTVCLQDGVYVLDSVASIPSTVRLVGAENTVIEASQANSIFEVATGGDLTLENLTLSNGNAGTGNGGAILNEGTLTLRDVNIYDSQAANGGAIYSTGTLTINGGEFSRNSATVAGGAIYATGTFDIQNARIIDNTAPEGSAIYEGE